MRLLLVGGTWFLGRAIAATLVERGHDVTTFNRGKTDRDVEGVTAIRGDRTSVNDLRRAAEQGPYDLVIDPSGYLPRDVQLVSETLGGSSPRLLFVSTVDAYAGWPQAPVSEESPLHDVPEDLAEAPYGHRKAACEELLREVWPGGLAIIRPGVILGPREPKGRLLWWLRRIAGGGEILAPGDPDRQMQPIDVDDAARFIVRLAESGWVGAVNLAAPRGHTTMAGLLGACAESVGVEAEFRWVPDAILRAAGVKDWTELPMWRPAPGTWQVKVERALGLGLRVRPFAETVARTWAWMRSGETVVEHWRTAEHGIDPVKERKILSLR